MALGWILFWAMKKLGSYSILVGIFYQLLIHIFSFSHNIYFPIDNMIITICLIRIFLPSIVHILNCYFEFIKPSWLLNSKLKPRQNVLESYRNQFYQQKIKIIKFIPTNNQLLEKTDIATCPMTKGHPEINWDLLSFFCCHLSPKKHGRKKFDTDSFDICANYNASSCATPNEIDLIPGT